VSANLSYFTETTLLNLTVTNKSKIQSEPSVFCEFGGVGIAYFAEPTKSKQFTTSRRFISREVGLHKIVTASVLRQLLN